MSSNRNFLYVLSVFFVYVHAVINFPGCSNDQKQLLQDAVNEALEAAAVSVGYLTAQKIHGDDLCFEAALDPLFFKTDIPSLINTYSTLLVRARDPTYFIDIFCNEDHIEPANTDQEAGHLFDTAYRSRGGAVMPLNLGPPPYPGAKPGARGSYTSIGFKQNDEYDCSDQAHIFIEGRRFQPPSDNELDLRPLRQIVTDGLRSDHNHLDKIYPLSETVLHELVHVAGGLGQSQQGFWVQAITDGPNGDTYRWQECSRRRTDMQSNLGVADAYAQLSKAFFLQIYGEHTYWATGEVYIDTLEAITSGEEDSSNGSGH